MRPKLCVNFRPSEGVGNAGCPMHPQPVCNGSKHTVVTAGSPEITRHSRTRMVLTVSSALSPVTNSSCHRHRRMNGFAEPGRARKTSADLTPATGARTTRLCRPLQRRSSCAPLDRSRVQRPALRSHRARDAAASTASHPNVRDDRDTPLVRDETGKVVVVIWVRREGNYFCERGLDRANHVDCASKIIL